MIHLVYVSSAVRPFSTGELMALLEKSRRNNERDGITGMLLYKDGNIMQALEGDEAAVEALHARIAADPRHRGLLTLLRGPLAERRFRGWSMALRDLHSEAVRATPGFSEFLNTPLTAAEFAGNPSRAEQLLLTFKRAM